MWRYLFWYRRRRIMNFYSHIPCGMWLRRCYLKYCRDKFLLTHPVWDVTMRMLKLENIIQISTHTSRVGCDSENTARPREWSISTHTSRVGCDISPPFMNDYTAKISTHTSRVGCDVRLCRTLWSEWNFYSHIPCGMWHLWPYWFMRRFDFYSHIPCGMWPLYIVYFNHIIPIYYRMDL